MKLTLTRVAAFSILVMIAGALFDVATVLANGEQYRRVGGTIVVTGGNVRELGVSELRLSESGNMYTEQISAPGGLCRSGFNRIDVKLYLSNDTVSVVDTECTNTGGERYAITLSQAWSTGVSVSQPVSQPAPSDPRIKNAETYVFDAQADKDGRVIDACNGLFYQFTQNGCIEFNLDISESNYLQWQSGNRDSILGEPCESESTGQRLDDTYNFAIRAVEPRVIENNQLAAKVFLLKRGQCDLDYKNMGETFESGLDIKISGVENIESLNGGPIESTDDATNSLCQVEGGLGWLLCPLLNTMASITDKAWETVVGTFLEIPPISTDTDSSNSLYQAWAVMRNIANVLFVIAFLLIIYSQLTSMGVSNYGIKKMLPRLIMGAILVNASFWLAAVAVDVSNIVGASIYNVLGSVTQATVSEVTEEPPEWSVVTSRILAAGIVGGAAYMAGFAVLVPLLLSSAFFIIGLVVTLAFRHAVLLILIVAAPFAAIAYMLPNTDKLSRSWWTLFKLLLIIYPLIAFVVGASILAGSVIFNAADNILLQLIGMAAPAMGILSIPFLVKATSGVLGKLGFSNPFSGIKNSAMERAKKAGSGITENNRNRRRARALDYANKNRGSTSRFRRASAWAAGVRGGGIAGRVKAKRELNKSNAETQQTIFEEDGGLGGKLKDIQSAMRQNRIVSSAAEGATKQQDLVEFANKTDSDLKRLAGGSPEMLTNLKQQRASAISQAASAVAIEISNLGVPQVATQLEAAIREGDRVRAEALTTKLTQMGGAGASKLREVYSNIDSEIADGRLDGSSETVAGAYKQMNSAVRSSGLKAKAADVYQHSIREGFIGSQETVMDRAKDKSTWATLSDAELAGQTTGKKGTEVIGGVEAAAENDALPDKERLLRVVGSDVARLAGNQEAIDLYSRIATSSGSTASANPTPPQATPAQSSTTSPPPSAASPQPSPVTPVTPTPGVVVTPSTSTGGVDSSQLNIPREFGNADGSSDSNS